LKQRKNKAHLFREFESTNLKEVDKDLVAEEVIHSEEQFLMNKYDFPSMIFITKL
jgi:hypothetical protein